MPWSCTGGVLYPLIRRSSRFVVLIAPSLYAVAVSCQVPFAKPHMVRADHTSVNLAPRLVCLITSRFQRVSQFKACLACLQPSARYTRCLVPFHVSPFVCNDASLMFWQDGACPGGSTPLGQDRPPKQSEAVMMPHSRQHLAHAMVSLWCRFPLLLHRLL
jgi:hypothetical protein